MLWGMGKQKTRGRHGSRNGADEKKKEEIDPSATSEGYGATNSVINGKREAGHLIGKVLAFTVHSGILETYEKVARKRNGTATIPQ